jgi:epoxyqueuosine reductase
VTPEGIHHFYQWLARGYHGQMDYLANRASAYEHPRNVLPGARSLLILATNYRTANHPPGQAGAGTVSQYAWGSTDYHDLIHQRLKRLSEWLQNAAPGSHVRGVVDTAPLLEREFARLAGLGWIGKHTLLINPTVGSWVFLAALLTDLSLHYDAPFAADHCGQCRACLDICPTNAFPQPYVLDATRCISYLTIELHGPLPLDQRSGLGDWVFGCDLCQQVCPWNRRAPASLQGEFQPRSDLQPLRLHDLFALSDEQFRTLYRRTPLWRARRRGLLRNAAIVLGNQREESGIEALKRGLSDEDPVIRGSCVWALSQIGTAKARALLVQQRQVEADSMVIDELRRALETDSGEPGTSGTSSR